MVLKLIGMQIILIFFNLKFYNREYPGFINQNEICPNSDDKENFALLIKELYYAFQQKGYVLSASVSGEKEKIDISYDVPTLSKYLNFISVAAYDFHGSWEKETGANAPLYPKSNANEIDLENTVDYAINYWLMNGADPKKIVSFLLFY